MSVHDQFDFKFPECDGCVNAELDQILCRSCKRGSNFTGEPDYNEELTYHEFLDFIRETGL